MKNKVHPNPLPVDRLSENLFAKISAEISQLITSGADVIRMDVGSPDLPPPGHIIEALAQNAAQVDSHGYQSHRGTAQLRNAWIHYLHYSRGIVLDDERILPLIGSKEGVFHFSLAWLNPGDLVLVPDPGYQTYVQAACFAGAKPVFLPLLPCNGYLPDLEAIPERIARKARILWVNYPHNPTGAIASQEFFHQAVEFCRHFDILLCHDAPYLQVTFDGYFAPSVFQVPDSEQVALEFSSLSKAYNMAGWRVGFAAGHLGAIEALLKLKTHADSGHFLPILEATVSALTGDQSWVEERNDEYRRRRDLLVTGLQNFGLEPILPKGAIYVWCPVPPGFRSEAFVFSLLRQAHVSFSPGSIFGQQGEGYIRISLTQPQDKIRQALKRMDKWFEQNK